MFQPNAAQRAILVVLAQHLNAMAMSEDDELTCQVLEMMRTPTQRDELPADIADNEAERHAVLDAEGCAQRWHDMLSALLNNDRLLMKDRNAMMINVRGAFDALQTPDVAIRYLLESYDVPTDLHPSVTQAVRKALNTTYEEQDADQIWRDEVMRHYTMLVAKRGPNPAEDPTLMDADEQTVALLNEAIRDSIDIRYMRQNYGDSLGV